MKIYKLGVVETAFANIIWENEPIKSGELVNICLKELNWKKSTTYTTLKKLSDKGFFQNINGVVCSTLSKDDYNSFQGEQFIEEVFSGSVPKFLATFISKQKLSDSDILEIKKLIEKGE